MRLNFARSLAVSLALAAMVLRAVLPDGWMPAAGASPFIICSVDAAQKDGKAPAQAPRSHAPCAFAAASPLAPLSAVATVPATSTDALHLAAAFADETFARTNPYRPNAARAPPAFS